MTLTGTKYSHGQQTVCLPNTKKVNGHWNGIPLDGHWHGRSLRQTHMDHNNLNTDSMKNKWHQHAATLDTHTSKPQHPQANLIHKGGHPTSVTNRTTTLATNTMDTTYLDNQKGQQHQQCKQWKQYTWTTQKKVKSKQTFFRRKIGTKSQTEQRDITSFNIHEFSRLLSKCVNAT